MTIFTWCDIILIGWLLNMGGSMLLMDRDVSLPDTLAIILLLIPGANFITSLIIVIGSAMLDAVTVALGIALMMFISDIDDEMW